MKNFASLFLSVLLFFIFNSLNTNKAHAQTESARVDSSLFQDLEFRPAGPTRGGRVTAVEGHPAHPSKFYMGGAGGSGLWKTENYGHTWINLTDGKGFKSTSIGAIEVADSDTSIIYVGTGTDGIRANVTTGRGAYKSTDAGESWEFIGLEDAGQIGAIEAHPENSDLVYAAALGHPFGKSTQRGVFRSKDGGENWEKILFASDSTGAIDLELNTEDPNEIYAALWHTKRKPWTIISGAATENGLYKSTDGGDNWKKLSEGLPQGLTGKADFAVTPADPDRIYALLEAPGDEQGLYRSDDRGESWELMNNSGGIMSRPFYFTNITAHPTNPDMVYVGNVRYWVSEDGGETFDRRPATHADIHDLWINPEKPEIQIQGNDGGATVTLNGGDTWSTQLNQPTAELYQVYTDDRFPYRLYAGQQDNSTIAVPSLPPYNSPTGTQGWWQTIGGCETGPAVPAPNDPETVYANCKGRFGKYNVQTGQEKNYYVGVQNMYGRNPADLIYRFQRVSPIEVSPHDSSVVYHGSQYLHRTTNGGETWEQISPDLTAFKPEFQITSGGPINRDITGEEHYSTLYSIRVSPLDEQEIWTGANDGPVHVTRDGGANWTDVTPEDLPPNGRVDAIDPSPHTRGTAYVSVHRRLLDDFEPYIYRTTDYGQSWTRLTDGTNGIPHGYPVRVVREDPARKGLLYAGTDWGLFISFNDGERWQQIKQGLPNTPITDINRTRNDLALSTMGRGFWIMDNVSILHQLDDAIATNKNHLYKPVTAYRMDYRGGSYNSGAPSYPSAGAVIDFNLPDTAASPVLLQITDSDGQPVRTLVGLTQSERRERRRQQREDPHAAQMQMPQAAPATAGEFTIRTGHNRYTWNLRYPGNTVESSDGQTRFGPGAGPIAVPGNFNVKLTIGDWSTTQPLTLKMDPRIEKEGLTESDLQAQLALNKKIRDAIGQAEKVAAEIDTLQARAEQAVEENPGYQALKNGLQQVSELEDLLITLNEGSYQAPMLIDQMQYLYYSTISADQRPGDDAYKRYTMLQDELNEVIARWQQLEQQIKDLNWSTDR